MKDERYLTRAKEMVHRYLPSGEEKNTFQLPEWLKKTTMKRYVGSQKTRLRFNDFDLQQALS